MGRELGVKSNVFEALWSGVMGRKLDQLQSALNVWNVKRLPPLSQRQLKFQRR